MGWSHLSQYIKYTIAKYQTPNTFQKAHTLYVWKWVMGRSHLSPYISFPLILPLPNTFQIPNTFQKAYTLYVWKWVMGRSRLRPAIFPNCPPYLNFVPGGEQVRSQIQIQKNTKTNTNTNTNKNTNTKTSTKTQTTARTGEEFISQLLHSSLCGSDASPFIKLLPWSYVSLQSIYVLDFVRLFIYVHVFSVSYIYVKIKLYENIRI